MISPPTTSEPSKSPSTPSRACPPSQPLHPPNRPRQQQNSAAHLQNLLCRSQYPPAPSAPSANPSPANWHQTGRALILVVNTPRDTSPPQSASPFPSARQPPGSLQSRRRSSPLRLPPQPRSPPPRPPRPVRRRRHSRHRPLHATSLELLSRRRHPLHLHGPHGPLHDSLLPPLPLRPLDRILPINRRLPNNQPPKNHTHSVHLINQPPHLLKLSAIYSPHRTSRDYGTIDLGD